MKKAFSGMLAIGMVCAALAGCGTGSTADSAAGTRPITVITREPGSGTRGAFIELFGVEVKGSGGAKTDTTTENAVVASSTNAVMTQVAADANAIGYLSLGSLNETVKALSIDGVAATAGNIKAGDYKAARPFNIATKGAPGGLAKDFIGFILSAEGQAIVETNGYIKLDSAPAFVATKPAGSIVVAGSSSVSPVMEKLKEGYIALNPGASVDIQANDSTAGMQAAISGACDIGMASRGLKGEELEVLTPVEIALDGIAVVVSNENPMDDLGGEVIKSIYTGGITNWDGVK